MHSDHELHDVRWTDRIELQAEGFKKIVRIRQRGLPLLEQCVPLGSTICDQRFSGRSTTSNIQLGSSGEKLLRRFSADEINLKKVSRRTAHDMASSCGMEVSECNPLWSIAADGLSWVVDSVTLLEQCVATHRRLLAALIGPWRNLLLRRHAMDDHTVWVIGRDASLLNGQRPVFGSEWMCEPVDVCCALHWLLNAQRWQELERCMTSIRRKSVLVLPSLLPTKRWIVHAVRVGQVAWIRRLAVIDNLQLEGKTAFVVSDSGAHGIRVDSGGHSGAPVVGLSGMALPQLQSHAIRMALDSICPLEVLQAMRQGSSVAVKELTPGDRAVGNVCSAMPRQEFASSKRWIAVACVRAATFLRLEDLGSLRIEQCIDPSGELRQQFLALLSEAPKQITLVIQVLNEYLDERSDELIEQGGPYRGLNPQDVLFPLGPRGVPSKAEQGGIWTMRVLLHRLYNRCGVSKSDQRAIAIGNYHKFAALRLEGHPCIPPFNCARTAMRWKSRFAAV